jgi:hypothetical protein
MALSRDEKILVAEYVMAGILAREVADRLLSGRITKTENSLFKSLVRFAGRSAVRGAGTAAMVARKHPAATIVAAGLIAHQQGVSMDTAITIAQDEIEMMQYHQRRVSPLLAPVQIASGLERIAPSIDPKLAIGPYSIDVKRKVTRANRAVKQGMKWLREGSKAATGAMPGTLPANAFRTTVKAAGMANPKTKSKPGKGKSIMNKLARRLKKWW